MKNKVNDRGTTTCQLNKRVASLKLRLPPSESISNMTLEITSYQYPRDIFLRLLSTVNDVIIISFKCHISHSLLLSVNEPCVPLALSGIVNIV